MTVLDQQRHARLIADIEGICSRANIPKDYLQRSVLNVCGPIEIDWLRHFNQARENGTNLALVGDHKNPEAKLMTMTAALLRNFIDARYVSVTQLLEVDPPDPHVLVCPNLFLRSSGKALPSWQVQQLYDVLLQRLAGGRLNIVYIESLEDLRLRYGLLFENHIRAHYRLVEV